MLKNHFFIIYIKKYKFISKKMNFNPFIILISNIIYLYNLVLIIYCIIQWGIQLNILNIHNTYISKIMYTCEKVVDPILNKIRKYLPDLGGIDISPVIFILFSTFIKNVLFTYFYIV